jgi:hypothetical protein
LSQSALRNRLNGIKLWAGGRIENNVVWGQGNSAVWAGTFAGTLEMVNNTIAYNMWDQRTSERNWAVVVGYPEEMRAPPTANNPTGLVTLHDKPSAVAATIWRPGSIALFPECPFARCLPLGRP